ncbi:MATE family efflux transporter [Candidatus Azobacteroides pseudotrichonymphae]|jgi:putative MATE family efflux protein|uniref:Multidrug export protein MepA n=1 Tax=Azobacteroides pseudotrichonymphae genomovar. CFP2 TaxID=511995 RepID=B6YRF3_AZOPC|nr:MATE family efflux transporter [Candidatus Azobacteroides pseudotrichonymphae]MDR0530222.1 MATE family efflux transporter [Bacteroidales bacterium OttesenSCG-928-I14]BAG83775.1 Na+-driven multidrug efflux pump NorM [Candidatus Azobacteroides pseudotrichonymphae genomovar. CFP2]
MKNRDALLILGTEKISKLLMQYATPAIVAMVATSLDNIIDGIFIGQGVGALALSGLAITFPLLNLGAAFSTLVGVGASTLLSIKIGKKDYKTANNILGNVVVLNLITGITVTLVALPFLNTILCFFGASREILPYAYNFIVIVLSGNVISHLYSGLNALLRSMGHPKKAMLAIIFSILINLVLNPLFIFGFGWGVRGSALADIISQTLVLCWQLYLFSNENFFIRWQKGIYQLKKKIVIDSLLIGLAPFIVHAGSCLIVVLINKQLVRYGSDLAAGAYGIINRVAFLFIMIIMGLNQGMQPIVGYNYGAGQYDRVIAVLKQAVFYATFVMIVGFTVVELFPNMIVSMFTKEKQLKDIAVVGLRWIFVVYPLLGFQMVSSSFFLSIGDSWKSIILSLTRQIIFLIPILFILPCYLGMLGVWVSMCIADFLSVLLAGVLLRKELQTIML